MNIIGDDDTVTIQFKKGIDEVILEQEKMLLLQFLPEIFIEMQKELDSNEE